MPTVTYDLLFDLLRYEKSREELQKFEETFYRDVVEYLKSKEETLLNANTPTAERELTRIQLGNIKKILKELYERRERKIISLSLYRIKAGSDMIDTSALLEEEKIFFDNLVLVFSKYRSDILENLLDGKTPFASDMHVPEKIVQDPERIVSVRFTKPVPKFLGQELETYGPFDEGDLASLPARISKIIIDKGYAQEIKAG